MLPAEIAVSLRSAPCGTTIRRDIRGRTDAIAIDNSGHRARNSTRTAILQPRRAKGVGIGSLEVSLGLVVLVFIRRAENGKTLRAILSTLSNTLCIRFLNIRIADLGLNPLLCHRINRIERRVTTVIVVIVVDVVVRVRILRDIHRGIRSQVPVRNIVVPLVEELVIAKIIQLLDMGTIIHVALARFRIGIVKAHIGLDHPRGVVHRVCPIGLVVQANKATHRIQGVSITALRNTCNSRSFTFTVFQGLIRRGGLQIKRQNRGRGLRVAVAGNQGSRLGFLVTAGRMISSLAEPRGIVTIKVHHRRTGNIVINVVSVLNGFFREVFKVRMIRLEIANHNIQLTNVVYCIEHRCTTDHSTDNILTFFTKQLHNISTP